VEECGRPIGQKWEVRLPAFLGGSELPFLETYGEPKQMWARLLRRDTACGTSFVIPAHPASAIDPH
jgi:hypothetical protein